MTEYDFSMDGYRRHMEKQAKVGQWAQDAEQHRSEFKVPFGTRSDVNEDDVEDGSDSDEFPHSASVVRGRTFRPPFAHHGRSISQPASPIMPRSSPVMQRTSPAMQSFAGFGGFSPGQPLPGPCPPPHPPPPMTYSVPGSAYGMNGGHNYGLYPSQNYSSPPPSVTVSSPPSNYGPPPVPVPPLPYPHSVQPYRYPYPVQSSATSPYMSQAPIIVNPRRVTSHKSLRHSRAHSASPGGYTVIQSPITSPTTSPYGSPVMMPSPPPTYVVVPSHRKKKHKSKGYTIIYP